MAEAEATDVFPVGAALGRYINLGKLASSRDSSVFAAFDPEADRKVIIKLYHVPPVERGSDEDVELREQRIAELVSRVETAAAIKHPNVARVLEVGSYDGGVFVASEFVDGITLRRWMEARDEPFPWRRVIEVFREAGRGLAAAHKQGVTHRDFRPDNVMIRTGGHVVVLDFGLPASVASERDESDTLDVSEAEALVADLLSTQEGEARAPSEGTPAYLAPELHLGGPATPASDQFAFCVAFYEALYGERPFQGDRRTTLAAEALHHRVREPPSNTDVPAWLRSVVLKGLQPRPADRHRSMDRLVGALDYDPKARRWRWVKGLGLLAGVLAVAGWGGYIVYAESIRCQPDPELVAGAWDADTRARLASVFASSSRPHAEQSWTNIEAKFDRWVQEWMHFHERACEIAEVRRDATPEQLALRYSCLDGRLAEVAAFASTLSNVENAEHAEQAIDRAAEAAAVIDRPLNCISEQTLALYPTPADDEQADVELSRMQLAEGWVALRLGNLDLARAKVERVSELLGALDYPALAIERDLLDGRVDLARGNISAGERTLHHTATRAAAQGFVQISARAWLSLVDSALARDDAASAELWVEHATIVVENAGSAALSVVLTERQGDVAAATGRVGDALEFLHSALERIDHNRSPLLEAQILTKLGRLAAPQASSERDSTSAQQYYERALSLMTAQLGPSHPMLARALEGLAALHIERGEIDDAVTKLEQLLAIDAQTEHESSRIVRAELALAEIELSRGRVHNAIKRFDHAAALDHRDEHRPLRLATALHGAGLARGQIGQDEVALTNLEEALALRTAHGSPLAQAATKVALAQLLWEQGESHHARAHTLASEARDTYEREGMSEPQAEVEIWLADHELQ